MKSSQKQNEVKKEQKIPITEANAAVKTHILMLQIEFSEKICTLEDMQVIYEYFQVLPLFLNIIY